MSHPTTDAQPSSPEQFVAAMTTFADSLTGDDAALWARITSDEARRELGYSPAETGMAQMSEQWLDVSTSWGLDEKSIVERHVGHALVATLPENTVNQTFPPGTGGIKEVYVVALTADELDYLGFQIEACLTMSDGSSFSVVNNVYNGTPEARGFPLLLEMARDIEPSLDSTIKRAQQVYAALTAQETNK